MTLSVGPPLVCTVCLRKVSEEGTDTSGYYGVKMSRCAAGRGTLAGPLA